MKRRNFLSTAATAGFATALFPNCNFMSNPDKDLKISLAQWSLNKAIFGKTLDPMDFAKKTRDFDINGIEYVSSFYSHHSDLLEKFSMNELAKELLKRSDDNGIDNVLIMIDAQGDLASSDENSRLDAIENHKKWIDFAAQIGCETLRLNLSGESELEKWTDNSVKSLTTLANYNSSINVTVENHGGLSSNGAYLANVMSSVNIKNCGTLPDFGNFCISGSPVGVCNEWYDKYKGVEELMPYAHAVSAKSYDFDEQGNETTIDFKRMMDIVKNAGYKGYVGIEYEGNRMSEDEGILATKNLLEKLI
jgi:sugar phosphate isomerase/epimerase